ncbi:hypothetical protein D3C80_1451850 [compost metagenome]
MRGGVDERVRVLQHALLDLPSEELAGDLERLVDLHRLADVDLAVFFRGVVEFGKGRVAGACVVPAVGAFFSHLVQAFDHLHGPAWLQLVEPDRQRGTHDAAAHQHDIDLSGFRGLGVEHAKGQGQPGQRQLRLQGDFHNLFRASLLSVSPATSLADGFSRAWLAHNHLQSDTSQNTV